MLVLLVALVVVYTSLSAFVVLLYRRRARLMRGWQLSAEWLWLRLPKGLQHALAQPFLLAGLQMNSIHGWLLRIMCVLLLLTFSLLLGAPVVVQGALLLLLFACLRPLLVAGKQAKIRQQQAVYGLPIIMDALALLLATGVPLMTALQKGLGQRQNPLYSELRNVLYQVRTGVSFQDALTNLCERLPRAEIRSFANLLLQASQQGNSLVALLEQQAAVRRELTAAAVEKQAQETPVRMLGPLALFIFPATIIPFIGVIAAKVMYQV